MHTKHTYRVGIAGIVVISAAWILAPVSVTFASTGGSQVNIAGNGQVIVRDAVVTAVRGNTITARAQWGDATISWTIIVNGMTNVSPEPTAGLGTVIQPDHRISFTGTMSFREDTPTVTASAVKNSDLIQRAVVVVGTAMGVARDSVTLETSEGIVQIRVHPGTIVTFEGNGASLRDIAPGDTVRAEGTLRTQSGELTAGRVVYSHPEPLASEEDQGAPMEFPQTPDPGMLNNILTWLKQTRGVLSVK